jgi:hypothetical protein
MSVGCRQSAAKEFKTIENQKQRTWQGARRAFEWVDALKVAEESGKPVVTPALAAKKSARRLWQRAKKNAQQMEQEDQQPASAEPAGTSNWRRSTSARTSSGNSGWQSGGEGQEGTSRRGSGWEEVFVGSPTKVEGLSARQDSIYNWPKSITVYSHDRHSECCWNKYREMDNEPCLRLDCRPLFDPRAKTHHDGRHQDVQAGLLQHKKNAPDCFLNMCKAVRVHLRVHAGRHCSIAFWCNHGKHRSVGCAELFYAILSNEAWARAAAPLNGCQTFIEHISLDHHRHEHKHCADCCDKNPYDNPNLKAARKMWELSEK